MAQLPSPMRAAVGLAAIALEQTRRLPDRAIELPMLAVSTALQMSLRAQQRYAALTTRGDEVLHRRPVTDEPPAWASFDAPAAVTPLDAAGRPEERKSVRGPRNGKPSAFDAIGDE